MHTRLLGADVAINSVCPQGGRLANARYLLAVRLRDDELQSVAQFPMQSTRIHLRHGQRNRPGDRQTWMAVGGQRMS